MTGNIQTSSSEPRVHRIQNQNVTLRRTRSLPNLNASVHSNQQTAIASEAPNINNSTTEAPRQLTRIRRQQYLEMNRESGAFSVNQGHAPKYVPRYISDEVCSEISETEHQETRSETTEPAQQMQDLPVARHVAESEQQMQGLAVAETVLIFDTENQTTLNAPQNQTTLNAPQNQTTVTAPQNQTTVTAPQSQTTVTAPQSQTTLNAPQNQTIPIATPVFPQDIPNKCLPRCTIL